MMVDGKLSSITIRNDDYKKKNKELRSGRNLVVREKMNWINSVEKYFNKYKKKKLNDRIRIIIEIRLNQYQTRDSYYFNIFFQSKKVSRDISIGRKIENRI